MNTYKLILQAIVDGEFDAVNTIHIGQLLDLCAESAESKGVDPNLDGLFDVAANHYTVLLEQRERPKGENDDLS